MDSATARNPARLARIGTVLLAFALAASAARGGVQDTPHNLVGSGRAALVASDDSTAVCAFCHTPHGEYQRAPLWQAKGLSANDGYRTFDSFGRSNVDEVGDTGSVSLSCMSCHDGVQAPNVALATAAQEVAARPPGGASAVLSRPEAGAFTDARSVAPRVDQSISHPVGMPYGAWGDSLALRAASGAAPARLRTAAPDDVAQRERGFRSPQSAVIDGVTVWWLETGASGRQRADIHLYSREVGEKESAPYVECASCHDPHADRPNFLRTGSGPGPTQLCASCHAM